MRYSLQGQEISRICFDYAVVLITVDGTELRIESPFRLASPAGDLTTVVEPDHLDRSGKEVVGLLRQRIAEADIADSGELSIRFADGQHLVCSPDEQFEAWTLVSAAGERMVCLPGGGVAHWQGDLPP